MFRLTGGHQETHIKKKKENRSHHRDVFHHASFAL